MLRAVIEELADEAQAFMVRDVRRRLVFEGAAMEEMREVGLDDRRRDGARDGEGVEGHGGAGYT